MRYEVYHDVNPTFGFGNEVGEEYRKVALVETDSIDSVFHATNHIEYSWTENPEILWHAERVRSTSVGDIVVEQETGKTYLCAPIGWKEIEPNLLNVED